MHAALRLSENSLPAVQAKALASLAELRLAQGRVDEADRLMAGFEDHNASAPVCTRIHLLRGKFALAATMARRWLDVIGEDRLECTPLLELLGEAEIGRAKIEAATGRGRALAEMGNTLDEQQYDEIFNAVDVWQHRWRQRPRPYLRYRKAWTNILIDDGRNCSSHVTEYSDSHATLYEYCADARSRKEISVRFNDASWVEGALQEFVERDLMIHLDNRYLSLALPENPYF